MLSPCNLNVRAAIADHLRQRFPALSDSTLDDATPLLADGAIDSLGILDLMTFVGEHFGIKIEDEYFEPDNFETFGHLVAFVERKRA
jgi:acyl carrier protein